MSGDEIRRIRRRLGKTQVQMAGLLGVHPLTVSRWERGENVISEPVARLVRLTAAAAAAAFAKAAKRRKR